MVYVALSVFAFLYLFICMPRTWQHNFLFKNIPHLCFTVKKSYLRQDFDMECFMPFIHWFVERLSEI